MINVKSIAAQTGVPVSVVLLSAAKIIEYREISGEFTDGMRIEVIDPEIYLTNPLAKLVKERLIHEQLT